MPSFMPVTIQKGGSLQQEEPEPWQKWLKSAAKSDLGKQLGVDKLNFVVDNWPKPKKQAGGSNYSIRPVRPPITKLPGYKIPPNMIGHSSYPIKSLPVIPSITQIAGAGKKKRSQRKK